MRKRALLVSLLLVSIIFFVGCGTNNQPAQDNTSTEGNQPAQESTNKEEKQEKIYLRWFAGATTSNWYPISVAVGGKVEKAMPNVITTVGPGGGKDNPVFVGKGEAQLGWSYSTDVVAAYNGLAPYDQKYTNIRHVATLWTAPLATAVKSDSNIKNWKDLIGKKIALGPATFAGNVLGRRILESYGIDEEKMKQNGGRIDNLDSNASADQMKDGLIDAIALQTDPNQAMFQDLNNSIRGGIRFVGIDDPAEWEKFQQMYPDYLKLEITANYANFSAHTKTVSVPGDCSVIIAREDVPDEVIYEVVKSIFDNLEETRAITGAVRDLELNIALEGCNIPVHTGALKYYKDKGLDVSKFEK